MQRSGVLATVCAIVVLARAAPAGAHSYPDPALRTTYDGVTPALPAGVVVQVLPSVVDELAVTNPTTTPLEVLAVGGEPFLRISAAGVQANLASPDWYATGTPEGGPALPPDVARDRGRGPARWVLVSRGSSWSEFDPRLHPTVVVPPAVRAAGKDAVLAVWKVPLRYGGRPFDVTGHVQFTPVRGGFAAALTAQPAGLQAGVLQGELPGVFLRAPAGRTVVISGAAGEPFLRLDPRGVQANLASPSWVADQRARGRSVATATGPVQWVPVSSSRSYSWLDARLRYPADLPPADVLRRTSATVVQRWRIPVTLDGTAGALTGTVSWVPRAVAVAQLTPGRSSERPGRATAVGSAVLGLLLVVGAGTLLVRRRRR